METATETKNDEVGWEEVGDVAVGRGKKPGWEWVGEKCATGGV